MKILHVVPSYKPAYVYGGTIESVARLCEALAHAGEEVTVYTTNANGKEELDVATGKEQLVDGVKVFYFKRIFSDPYYIAPSLWKQLYRNCKNYDVVHIHSWWNMIVIVATLICTMRRVKTIVSPRGMFSDYVLNHSKQQLKRLIHLGLGRWLLKKNRFHATSEAEYKECAALIPGWKGFVIPNIIWLPPLRLARPEHACFTIIFLSRIHPKKGLELLMEALSHLSEPCMLKIAGFGDEQYMQQLKKKADLLGVSEKIEWLGWRNRDEKFSTLLQADLFALTSYNENFGNVVIEALYAGTPVLVSSEVGACNFVEVYNLGWICKPEINSIVQQLQQAMADTEKRKHINAVAPGFASNYYSEKALQPLYLQHYREG